MYKLRISLFLVLLIIVTDTYAQISGCTDPEANNYNSSATINDGSCTYNVTIYNPPVKFLLSDEIEESSGLAYLNGKLWTINYKTNWCQKSCPNNKRWKTNKMNEGN